MGKYKFGFTGQSNVENRFSQSGYKVNVLFSWWLPEEMTYFGEQLLLSTIEKDFYLEEKLDGITEMREFDENQKKYIVRSLYNVKKDYLEKFPKFNVKEPWNLGWKKLYFIEILIND